MIVMSLVEAARIMSGTITPVLTEPATFAGVSIDSRTLASGNLFFAIRGEQMDGHDFLPQAHARGASGYVVKSGGSIQSVPMERSILVHDTHTALIELAREYRRRTDARIVGITGSNGKTTTKEFTAQLLALVEPSLFASTGNLNNLYGMPLSLLAMPQSVTLAVMEMGISRPGEMRQLASIVVPDLAVVTNAGAAHLEYLGSVDNVAHEKLSMIREAAPQAPLIVNGDDTRLRAFATQYHNAPITYGFTKGLTFTPESVTLSEDGTNDVSIEGVRVHVPYLGGHMVHNFVCAYAIARTLGYSFDKIDTSTLRLSTAPMRGESLLLDGVRFIVDCYNANPESMRLGLEAFGRVPATSRRVLILGDMRELGEESARYHDEALTAALGISADLVLLVGNEFGRTVQARTYRTRGTEIRSFETSSACRDQITSLIHRGDLVYLKGSRGTKLEVVLEPFREGERA